ncbi:MAG: hypothetical protein AB4206_10790 [Xenococcaceae cyanobacterium]
MLDQNPMFDGNLGQQDNSIPFLGDVNDLNLPFLQDEGGSFSAPKLDFDVMEEYREADEFNFPERFELVVENHPFLSDSEQTHREILGYLRKAETIRDRIKDIIGEKQFDDDVLLNSKQPRPGIFPDLNPEELPFPQPDGDVGEGIMGKGKFPPRPGMFKDLNPEELPFPQPDGDFGEGIMGKDY